MSMLTLASNGLRTAALSLFPSPPSAAERVRVRGLEATEFETVMRTFNAPLTPSLSPRRPGGEGAGKSSFTDRSDRRSSRLTLALTWLGLICLLATPSAALEVTIVEPSSLLPIFGMVEVVVEVHPEDEVTAVELFVDSLHRGRLNAPPWRFQFDAGQQNRPHRLEVRAYGADGNVATAGFETPAIRVDEEVAVELQQLYVTATDRDGHRVLDLAEKDFRVLDDGKPQGLSTFAGGDVAITATLLLDSSESMRGERLDAARRGARAFLDGLRDRDEACLMLFSDRLLERTPFTAELAPLHASLDAAQAYGETAINDHLFMALQLLDERQGRRVVVLFTDGADLDSVLDIEDVAWKARRSQALIYWLRLDDGSSAQASFSTAWRDSEGNRRQVDGLERLVERSGGRVERIADAGQIEAAFAGIVAELREQYVLGYQPADPRNDGSWREVEVRTMRAGVELRARGGYVDE